MSTKKKRQQAAVEPVNTLPTNEFGEIILGDDTIELSQVPTTEVDVASLPPKTEETTTDVTEQNLDVVEPTDETPVVDDDVIIDGSSDVSETPVITETNEPNVTVDLAASDAPLKLEVEGAVQTERLGVTRLVQFESNPVVLQAEKELDRLTNRLQSNSVRLADYDDNEGDAVVNVICDRIEKHFSYILGTTGFRDEKQKIEQLVTFATQLSRLNQLQPNVFFKVMDFILTQLRTHGEKLTPTTMFRFNIVTAKDHSTIMTRHNDLLNVCYKFAHNYADRSKLVAQIDFNKVCAGSTNKQAELLKSYFRKLANN